VDFFLHRSFRFVVLF